MMWLEIGPGNERIPGFKTLNAVKTPITDYVGDARRPPLGHGQWDLIYSSHCIEHIDWWDIKSTIEAWARLLTVGGKLEVFTVDGYKLMKALVHLEETGEWIGPGIGTWKEDLTKRDPYTWAVGRMLNYPKKTRADSAGHYWMHRAILTPNYLKRCFEEAGLVNIERLNSGDVRGKDHGWINMGFRGEKC